MYILPLAEPYCIYRPNTALSSSDGLYQLVERLPSLSGGAISLTVVVPRVAQIDFKERVIFGTTMEGFFILDARNAHPKPVAYTSAELWYQALQELGIGAPNLKSPDSLAVGMPDQVLHPGRYRAMGNFLNLSDDVWCVVVQCLGIGGAFLIGLARRYGQPVMLTATVIGLLTNVVAMILIAGGGPSGFLGFFVFPFLCMFAAAVGQALKRLFNPRSSQDLPLRNA
jgi:hypothetical protein